MSEVDKILDYIGASKQTRNVGTKVKLSILETVIFNCIGKKNISLDKLVNILSLNCNITPRTMRENYIEPLISVGILKQENNIITYIGLEEPEPELSDEEKKKITEEALK